MLKAVTKCILGLVLGIALGLMAVMLDGILG